MIDELRTAYVRRPARARLAALRAPRRLHRRSCASSTCATTAKPGCTSGSSVAPGSRSVGARPVVLEQALRRGRVGSVGSRPRGSCSCSWDPTAGSTDFPDLYWDLVAAAEGAPIPPFDGVGRAVGTAGAVSTVDAPRRAPGHVGEAAHRLCRAGVGLLRHAARHLIDDVDAGGPVWVTLAPHATAPFTAAYPLRLLGGVHRRVLGGRAPSSLRTTRPPAATVTPTPHGRRSPRLLTRAAAPRSTTP